MQSQAKDLDVDLNIQMSNKDNKNPEWIVANLFKNTKSLLIMGIINATPDSFSGDGIFKNNQFSLEKELENMLEQSVDIIDVGGESTRPPSVYENVKEVTENEELDRVLPIIEFIKKNFPLYISIDTKKPLVAKEAV